MSEPSPAAEAGRWFRHAREDLDGAMAMLSRPAFVPRHVGFLAQQAAEKSLKAALILLQIEFPKTHNLDALRNMLPEGWRVKAECPILGDLTEWAVEARYPGDWPEATLADAQDAMAKAGRVLDAVSDGLAKQGVKPEPGLRR